jgi:hypothetical protein
VGNAPPQGTPENQMKLDAVCPRIASAFALLLAITVYEIDANDLDQIIS